MIRQFLIMVTAALVAAFILVKADIAGRLTYSMEKARLRALRESLPSGPASEQRSASGRALAATILPAVVSISTERTVTRRSFEGLDPRIHEFLFPDREGREPEPPPGAVEPSADADAGSSGLDADDEESDEDEEVDLPASQGSGFVFDAAKGYILTNCHVVEEGDKITVRLADDRQFDATLMGLDEKTDLAVLKIDADRLQQLPLGDSSTGEVGDEVFAVGNPFGLPGSVSRGIISAKNRSNIFLENVEYQGFIQTDAVINMGNSGGPLVNARGEVIGINNAIATATGAFDGIGFAIPSNRASRVIPHLIRGEQVTRGYLGVQIGAVDGLREDVRTRLAWSEPHGVVVMEVFANTPAAAAGLQAEDILVSIENRRLTSSADLTQTVADMAPGTMAEAEVWRGKSLIKIKIEVGKQPENFSTRGWRPRRPPPVEK